MGSRRPTEQDWEIRTALYRFYVENARAPSDGEVADEFGISTDGVATALLRLHEAHALFLDPKTEQIRMLNPFSAVPTSYVVEIGARSYFANCAWDMLAIPAMLGKDALIHARLEVADSTIQIPVIDGEPRPDRNYVVNFSVPFSDWYSDLIYT
jgi:Alkylmercury lyase